MAVGQILRWLGGRIDIEVRIETGVTPEGSALWDVALWDVDIWSSVDLAFEDITAFVKEVTYQRGTERWDTRFTGGSATVTLDNTTGLFTPDGTGDRPWSLPFRPGRRVQISCLPDPTDPTRFPLFTGRIDDTGDEYADGGAFLTTTFQLIDLLAELGANNPPALDVATGVQSTDDRVNAALDYGGADGPRDIQPGLHTMATSFLAQSTLEECQRAADAEGGSFFAEPDGTLVFKARDWLTTDTRSTTVQGYLGYAVNPDPLVAAYDIAADSVRTSWNLARVRNDIQFARDGGVEQRVIDADSIVRHGRRSYPRRDFNLNSDGEVLALAERMLEVSKDSRRRLDSLSIVANADPDNEDLNRLFYGAEMGDLLSVELRMLTGWSVPGQLTHIVGIRGRITPDDWQVTFTLDDTFARLLEEAA